ncbi:MAG: ABC transporter transmembrane domain-containing protein [Ruthenibacterium lactatiformans]
MPDKQLLRLLGEDKRYIYRAVVWMLTGSLCSIGFTACLCYGLHLLLIDAKASLYLLPFVLGAVCAAVRFLATIRAASVRDRLGRSVREKPAGTAVRKAPAPRCTGDENRKNGGTYPTGHRGIEQLDLYYSSYLPQFFYAMLSPLLLFGICVFINWRVAAVLLACVPLIPVSIVAVSRFAKRIFAKYWGKYTAMGDVFLDSVQGLKELKLFRADARRQAYMNENAEEFRKITMKVLVMQLASVTIMDLVAFGGAGIGAALAVAGTQNGGGIAAALFLVLVAAEFFLPLRAFGSAFHVAMNGVSAGRMMLTLLEEPEPAWGEAQTCGGRLELEDVHFSYAPGRETLHGVSVVFPDRGMTAIVGESGCGKTTAAKLLTGALRPGSGRVLLDGKPVESLDRQAYYASLAHVSWRPFSFTTPYAPTTCWQIRTRRREMWRALALVRLDGLVQGVAALILC